MKWQWYLWKGRGDGVEERWRDRDTGEVENNAGGTETPEKWRTTVSICVWREMEEDVCVKKEGNGEMGKMGIFGVCGNK